MQLRKNAGLKTTFVAAALDVAEYTVRRWENGTSEPTLKLWQVQKLAELYNCDLDDLVNAFGSSPPNKTKNNKSDKIKSEELIAS